MIDHMNLPVSDTRASRAFYDAVLATLGYRCLGEDGPAIGYGTTTWQFGIEPVRVKLPPIHVAFKAINETRVDAFYETALTLGATSNGAPGPRPGYGDTDYAAFVRDPDGHNIEAVFRDG